MSSARLTRRGSCSSHCHLHCQHLPLCLAQLGHLEEQRSQVHLLMRSFVPWHLFAAVRGMTLWQLVGGRTLGMASLVELCAWTLCGVQWHGEPSIEIYCSCTAEETSKRLETCT